jgi:uncharacterized protein (TIGR02266 family)
MSQQSKKRRRSQRAALAYRSDPVPSSVAPACDDTGPSSVFRLAAAQESLVAHDHREHPRVELHVEIDLHSDAHFFSGLSGDVSEGGLFVQTYRPLVVGQEVDVTFELEGRHVHARATVRWHREKTADAEPGFGLEFDRLGGDDRAAVEAFCQKRAPLYYEVV